MRFGIGLIALLMGVGLLLYLQADHTQKILKVTKPAREAAAEIAGQDLRDSYELKPVEASNKTVALELTRVAPASPLLNMYDLKVGDRILEIGPFAVKDSDVDMMRAQFAEVGARRHALVVMRGTERLTLENHGSAARMGGKSISGINIPSH